MKAMQEQPFEIRLRGFLRELGQLTEKWQIELYGCGCCYAVHGMKAGDDQEQYLRYVDRERGYSTNPLD